MHLSNIKGSVIAVFLTVVLFACQAPSTARQLSPPSADHLITLLILPFKNMAAAYGPNVMVRCPLCGRVYQTGDVALGSDAFLTEQLSTMIKQREGLHLIPFSQAQGAMARLLSKSRNELSELALCTEIGSALGADIVLTGHVYRFKDRTGRRYSVETPASVGFDIDLVLVRDGRVVWNGHVDETQQALTENLFQISKFVQRKGRWITADEMSITALENMLQSIPLP